MKVYWVTAGLGALAAIVGAAIYLMTDQSLGTMVFLGGLIVATLGVAMRIVMIFVGDKAK